MLLQIVYPRITRTPPNMVLYNVNQTSLEVEFESSYKNTTRVLWFKGGQRLSQATSVETYYRNDEIGSTTLTFDPARRSDSGIYTVEVFNDHESILPSSRRSVFSEPFELTIIGEAE